MIVQLLHANLPDWNVKHGHAHKERYEYASNNESARKRITKEMASLQVPWKPRNIGYIKLL